MAYYPVCLDLKGRRCVVVGGGRVAARKVRGLVACDALVLVVSPHLDPELTELQDAGTVEWLARGFREGDLAGRFLAIAATDDAEVQARVQAEAERSGILLNVADVPGRCNFILPAVVRRGDLTIAVATGGRSPALARNLRRSLEKRFGEEYAVLTEILGILRSSVLAAHRPQKENEALFNRLRHHEMAAWIANGERKNLIEHVSEMLGDAVDRETIETVRAMLGNGSSTQESG